MASDPGSAAYSTENRLMHMTSSLSDDFLLHQLHANEAISEPFHLTAEVFCTNHEVDFDSVIGQAVSIRLSLPGGDGRFFHGVFSKVTQGNPIAGLANYALEIEPWFALLRHRKTCRIFAEKTVREVLEAVFSEYDQLEFNLVFSQEIELAYCVQYRESDFDFASRIMEESGLGYYFEHEEALHRLVVFDRNSKLPECPTDSEVPYRASEPSGGAEIELSKVSSLQMGRCFRPGSFSTSDYNPEDPGDHREPGAALLTTSRVTDPVGARDQFEVFDYPGRFEVLMGGEQLTMQRALVSDQESVDLKMASSCPGFTAGHVFSLIEHPRSGFNDTYLITKVGHYVSQPIGVTLIDQDPSYENQLEALPHGELNIPFVPSEKTPKPVIRGVQVATVVSTDSRGLDVDEYGRVLVKFPWDRASDTTSCRVRVSQSRAGKKWGEQSWPHVGQEVLVAFIEGDPDRPIVVGRVFNAANMPPFKPAQATRTSISDHAGVLIEIEGGRVSPIE